MGDDSPNLVHHDMYRIVIFIASPRLLTTVFFLEEPALDGSGEGGNEEEGVQETVGRHGFLECFVLRGDHTFNTVLSTYDIISPPEIVVFLARTFLGLLKYHGRSGRNTH